MPDAEAKAELDRIYRKLADIEAFEARQIRRFTKINQAKVEALVEQRSNLLVMSEV